MELKCHHRHHEDTTSHRSNRTFMELKFDVNANYLRVIIRSNRTFMELKFHQIGKVDVLLQVLIVPLWN